MNKYLFILCLLLAMPGCGNQKGESGRSVGPFDHEFKVYASLLAGYVVDGKVRYAELKTSRDTLDRLVNEIAGSVPADFSEKQKLAFYINAYNILTLRSIIDAYPVRSIKDIDGVWDDKKWVVGGNKMTLNDIEHKILRKEFDEPRIHMAINCASIGCPPLSSMPYTAVELDQLLNDASARFCNTQEHNSFDIRNKIAGISSLFDWFGDDFIEKYYTPDNFAHLSQKENAVLNFIIAHQAEDVRAAIGTIAFEIEYNDYDWSLNEYR